MAGSLESLNPNTPLEKSEDALQEAREAARKLAQLGLIDVKNPQKTEQ